MPVLDSPQMASLKRTFGVFTRRDLVRAIRDDYARETEEPWTLAEAEAMLDPMLDAEFYRLEAGEMLAAEAKMEADTADERPICEPHGRPLDCEQCAIDARSEREYHESQQADPNQPHQFWGDPEGGDRDCICGEDRYTVIHGWVR